MVDEPKIFDPGGQKEYQEKMVAQKPAPEPAQSKEITEKKEEPKRSTWETIKAKAGTLAARISDKRPKPLPEKDKRYQLQKYKEKQWEQRMEKIKAEETRIKGEARAKAAEIKEKLQKAGGEAKEKIKEKGIATGKYIKESGAYQSAKAGLEVGKQETKEKFKQTMYRAGKETGRLPATLARKGVEFGKGRYQAMRESIRMHPGKGTWHSGLLWSPGAASPTRGSGGIAARVRAGGYSPGGTPHGRMPRSKIPRGLIKPYWSKKLKKMARTNIRRYGQEEGMTKTRTVAQMLGWKMQ